MLQKLEWFVLGVVFIGAAYAIYSDYELGILYNQDHVVLAQIVQLINNSQAK